MKKNINQVFLFDESKETFEFEPKKEATGVEAKIEQLVVSGATIQEIGAILGITPTVLRKKYSSVFSIALPKITARISQKVVEAALAGDTRAAIFFLKSRANWGNENQLSGSASSSSILKVPNVVSVDAWKKNNIQS